MPTTFAYKGLDTAGKTVTGEITAEDAQGAAALLKARAIHPMAVTAAAGNKPASAALPPSGSLFKRRNMAADVAILTRQLANLVAGGVQLMAAFAALTEHTENPRLRAVLVRMQEDVHGGSTLWEALAAHPTVFPPLFVNMVKAGEASGQLASVLNWLADYQEQEQTRRMQIRGALMYPTLLVVAGTLAILLLVVFVVPKFSMMFTEFGQALPLPTMILLAISSFMSRWAWAVALGIVLLVVGLRRYGQTPAGKLVMDGWRLKAPLFGALALKAAMSRFARTTATLLQGGVPLLDALSVVRDVLDNEVLARATDDAREGMREGERFAARLQATGVFPGFLTHMIGIGEETGDLRSMLKTVAGTYDIEVEATLKGLVSMLEPLIIITVGVIMGGIILSMLLPIFSINLAGG
jgi:type II secretory pathway component PulF